MTQISYTATSGPEEQAADRIGDKQPASDNPITMRDYFDSPQERARRGGKRHHTERFKGAPLVERWTVAKGAYIGYLTGRGYTSKEIENILRDGTSSDTVRGQWRRWGLPIPEHNGTRVALTPVALKYSTRTKLAKRARAVGITPDEFIRRIIISVVDDDLYRAVVDDRFEPKPTREALSTVSDDVVNLSVDEVDGAPPT